MFIVLRPVDLSKEGLGKYRALEDQIGSTGFPTTKTTPPEAFDQEQERPCGGAFFIDCSTIDTSIGIMRYVVETSERLCLAEFAILPAFRRQGAGTAAMHQLIENIGPAARIDVRFPKDGSEWLVAFFEKFGFQVGIDHRRRLASDPDLVLMTLGVGEREQVVAAA